MDLYIGNIISMKKDGGARSWTLCHVCSSEDEMLGDPASDSEVKEDVPTNERPARVRSLESGRPAGRDRRIHEDDGEEMTYLRSRPVSTELDRFLVYMLTWILVLGSVAAMGRC